MRVSHARNVGLSVADGEVDAAIENIAQNKLTLREMQRRMEPTVWTAPPLRQPA